MAEKPTYDDLEQRIKELEKERIESKRAEDALNDKEIKFQDLANSIDDIFFALDNDLNYTFWNKTCSHLFGMSPEIMIGKSFFDFEFNKGFEWIADIYKEVIHHRQSRNFESSLSLGDKKIWYEIKAYSSSSGCAVLLKDITERKQAEKSLQKAHNELEKKVKQRTNELYNELQQRKQTENKLKESEENLRSIFDNMQDIYYKLDVNGKILAGSPSAVKLYKYDSLDEIIGRKANEFVYNIEDNERFCEELYKKGYVRNHIIKHKNKDGEPIFVETNTNLIFDDQGNPEGVVGVFREISDRLQADQELQYRKLQLEAVFKNLDASIYISDMDSYEILYMNDHMKKVFGKNLTGKICWESIHDNQQGPCDFCTNDKLIDVDGNPIEPYIWEIYNEKLNKWYELRDQAIPWTDGRLVRMEMATDVTERKRIENALNESEENFRALIETMDDIVLVGNPDGSIIYSNPVASSKLGYNQKELCKLKIIDLHPPYLQKEAAFIVSEMISGKQDVCPLPVLGKNGNLIPVETRVWFGKWNGTDCIFGISKDLSKEQEALQKFDQIFRMNPALMAVSKIPDRTFTDVNDAFQQTLGYSKEEIIGKSSLELNLFINKEEQNQVSQMLSDYGHFRDIEMQVRTKQGGVRYGLFSGDTIETQDTKYFLTVMVDITERKQAEKNIVEKESFLNSLINTIPIPIFYKGREGIYQGCNTAYEEFMGKSRDQLIGKSVFDISPKELAQKYYAKDAELLDSGELQHYESKVKNGRGEMRDVFFDKSVYTDHKGKIIGLIGTVRDITERKQMEEILQESELKYREFVDRTEDIVIRVDNKGNFIFINHTAEKLFGTKSEDCAGLSAFDFIHPDDKEKTIQAFTEWGEKKLSSHFYENRMIDFAGRIRNISWTFNIHYETDGTVKHVNSIAKDITDLKQIQMNLEKAKNKAERGNKAKSEFLANMSHEIRTPLNAINGFSELLIPLVTDKKQKNYLKSIKTAGKSLLSLINDILDLSKIEANKMQIQYAPVNILVIFDEIKQIFNTPITDKSIEFSMDCDKNIQHLLLLDEIRLRQILLNIVGNAIKFTKEGYIKLMVKQTDSNKNKRTIDLEISVKDTGMGIAKADQDKIFNIFEQQDGQSTRAFGGTGLGLSISKRFAEMMNGQIKVVSEVNEGSTFTILLRDVEVSTVKAATVAEEINDTDNIVFDKAKILLVDDVRSNREFLSEMLNQANLNVRTAENGQEAIFLAHEYQPDAIIMDIKMPVLDGFEAAKHLKKNPETKQIPIVILSANPATENKRKLSNIGVEGFLSKPASKNKLFNELVKYIGSTTINSIDNVQTEPDYSLIDIVNSPELVKILKEEILPFCESLKNTGVMNDIKLFGNRVKALGKKFNVQILKKYGEDINESAQNYDLTNIKIKLQTIAGMIQKID